ncbi:MAG: C/D box methylation guide ribonucleoprotein complex aNOP56 subunit [Candidatus Asgardarchaeia archaeon]
MRYYLVDSFVGTFIIGENKNIIAYKPFTEDKKYDKNLSIQKSELLDEQIQVIKECKITDNDELIIEDNRLITPLKNAFPNMKINFEFPSVMGKYFRENIVKLVVEELGLFKDRNALASELNDISNHVAREKVKEAAQRRDKLVVQVIDAIDDVTKIINLMASRTREWYSLYFPELDKVVDNHKLYFKLVSEIGKREDFIKRIDEFDISDDLKRRIKNVATKSIGANITKRDLSMIRAFASESLNLIDLKENLEKYLTDLMNDVAPNLTGLVGPLIGARLIRLAGGLIELSKLPSSTIQVLGAEKALFLALKKKGKPPKHGVIFQHILIHSAPRWLRGKIARAMAGKISIAARVDAFSGAFVADKLKKDLEERVKEIKRKYPKPPAVKKIKPSKKRKKVKEKVGKKKKRRRGKRKSKE